ncbi:MAG: hypothetical protein J6Q48_07405 [Bacteroidaceae bacterium]|nr:hypothetical protein [Bacteroidaceae bacterium]
MRKPAVTRTFKTAKVRIMVANTETRSVSEVTLVFPRPLNGKALEKAIKARLLDTPNLKYVNVVGVEYESTLYGMDEETFLKHARIMPPRAASNCEDNGEDNGEG